MLGRYALIFTIVLVVAGMIAMISPWGLVATMIAGAFGSGIVTGAVLFVFDRTDE